ncbi:MAG: CRISPR-associated endoribonuclease Cas6 [Bacteroidetes bacterium]|nr:CRISPR-associated endoribonuclease Cas6 [Bacteroidota bacterium]
MRIRIVFSLKNRGAYVPFHHQFLLAQTVKGLVMLGAKPEYYTFNHYNFSGLKGQTKISRKGLHFYSSKVTLVFSSPHREFVNYFLTTLFSQKELMIGNLQLVPESHDVEHPILFADTMKFLCISPIVLLPASFNDEQGKRFISPESDEFSDFLYDNTLERMEAVKEYSTEKVSDFHKFQLLADHDYLLKIQSGHKKFARIYPLYDADVKYEVRGYTFPFTLYAPQPVQQFIYENGLGCYSHKGFGMLDVAHANSLAREESMAMYA